MNNVKPKRPRKIRELQPSTAACLMRVTSVLTQEDATPVQHALGTLLLQAARDHACQHDNENVYEPMQDTMNEMIREINRVKEEFRGIFS